MSSSDDEPALVQPQPSGEWFRNRSQRLAEQQRLQEDYDLKRVLQGLQKRADAEIARWGALPCGGEVERVGACPDSFAATCEERDHGMCPRRQIERKTEEERLRRANRRKELETAGVSPRTLRAVFDAEPERTDAVVALETAFALPRKPSIVVLQGGVGCGKSCAAALWAIRTGARWLTAKALARMGYEDELAVLGKVPSLVLDDLGTEYADAKGFFVSNLDGLIDDRYARELPTVITTNVAPEDFKTRYGERIADRIREAGVFRQVKGDSLRRRA